jgi:hypothetical protein
VKVLGHLVPREHKVEHSNSLKNWTDEEIDGAIELIRGMLAERAAEGDTVIEATAEPVALAGPAELEQPHRERSTPTRRSA